MFVCSYFQFFFFFFEQGEPHKKSNNLYQSSANNSYTSLMTNIFDTKKISLAINETLTIKKNENSNKQKRKNYNKPTLQSPFEEIKTFKTPISSTHTKQLHLHDTPNRTPTGSYKLTTGKSYCFFFYKFLIFNLTPNGCENRTFLKRHTPTFFIFSAKIAFFFLSHSQKYYPKKYLGGR
jgi:hypothetical protein